MGCKACWLYVTITTIFITICQHSPYPMQCNNLLLCLYLSLNPHSFMLQAERAASFIYSFVTIFHSTIVSLSPLTLLFLTLVLALSPSISAPFIATNHISQSRSYEFIMRFALFDAESQNSSCVKKYYY